MKVYIRAAIAQFLISGPGTVLPAHPSRLETQATGSKITECAAKKQDEPQTKLTQNNISKAKTTWASITRNGLRTPPAHTKVVQAMPKATNSTRPSKIPTASTKSVTKDELLFLRLGNEQPWRKPSPFGVREAVAQMLEIPQNNIEHIYHVSTGFAIRAKNQESRVMMLSLAGSLVQRDAILE
ncbi:EKA-like protein [Blumeria hordei DH14]|uniref:EKA-like protein n=1 Tax=Blumeria graminis f. sp. hordei (strain DH14) TaxID=546991 RepID=N1JBV4_BLUG1|nr:EKA-like protein [Blumeria hordei DH14]